MVKGQHHYILTGICTGLTKSIARTKYTDIQISTASALRWLAAVTFMLVKRFKMLTE